MRSGENALDVAERVKTRIKDIQASLPSGVKVVPVTIARADPSHHRQHARDDHRSRRNPGPHRSRLPLALPSASIPLLTMPAAVLISFIPLRMMGISVNVMSLAGVAIAFGELIDASIVVAEQTHKKLDVGNATASRFASRCCPRRNQGSCRSTFFALLVIGISFLPVLTLEGQEGRMFRRWSTPRRCHDRGRSHGDHPGSGLRLLLTRARRFDFQPAWLNRLANTSWSQITPEEKNPSAAAYVPL